MNFGPGAGGGCLKSGEKVWSSAAVFGGCKEGCAIMTGKHGT